jgi:hypothetical protein
MRRSRDAEDVAFLCLRHNPAPAEDRAYEFALDHKPKGETNVRGVYDRALLLTERRKLINEWSAFLTSGA